MKDNILVTMIAMICCGCGAENGAPGHKKAGEPLYLTDSLASQVNTPIPDSNRNRADSATIK